MEEVRVTTTPASAQFRAISQHLPRFRNKMGAWIRFRVCKIKFPFNSFSLFCRLLLDFDIVFRPPCALSMSPNLVYKTLNNGTPTETQFSQKIKHFDRQQ